MTLTLKIYTMTHCPTCEETQRTANDIADRFPGLSVEVINLDDPEVEAPPEVFSVPTYMLNGAIVSLGNPYLHQLEASILQYAS